MYKLNSHLNNQAPTTLPELVDWLDLIRPEVVSELDNGSRADLGQFFTPAPVARLLASMFDLRQGFEVVRVLDAGAGMGMLTAAMVAELCQRPVRPKCIQVSAYEIAEPLADRLRVTLQMCEQLCQRVGVCFEWQVIQADFLERSLATLLHELTLFGEPLASFNCAILNPPYHKINSSSTTGRRLKRAGIDTGNLYTAFLWLAARLLEKQGEMVTITPRSFCNGPYFRPFRKAWLDLMALQRLHLFETRNQVFGADEVLQESLVMHAVKQQIKPTTVVISQNLEGYTATPTEHFTTYSDVVHPDDPELFIHVVPDVFGAGVRKRLGALETNITDLGLEVSTGRVVDFRAKAWLRSTPEANAVPLIYPGHLANGYVAWPKTGFRKPNALVQVPSTEALTLPAGVYVLVKRFTAKEEQRRVVAAIYEPSRVTPTAVAFENHLNYFHQNGGGLPLALAKGLTAYLNSTPVDDYLRQFNGHTQVNATDLRWLPYPTEAELLQLGTRIGDVFPEQEALDRLIAEVMPIMPDGFAQIDPQQVETKVQEALAVLEALGAPPEQRNERSALTLLALAGLRPGLAWKQAANPLLGITEIMDYLRDVFGKRYKPNTRETIRRFTVHQFVQIGLVEANPDRQDRPVNSPHNRYQLTAETLKLLQSVGARAWKQNLAAYLAAAPAIGMLRVQERATKTWLPVTSLDGSAIKLTAGGQNKLLKAILEQFCPAYTPGGIVAYLGDAGKKLNAAHRDYLAKLGVRVDVHGKMPDVVVHLPDKNWLVIIEAVTTHGPIGIKRHNELKVLFKDSTAGLVYVTAFETRKAMKTYLGSIAWETDVWVAEEPSHLIHFNGERFLGPYGKMP
jgi:adenine-specific DNA-methyltransferase